MTGGSRALAEAVTGGAEGESGTVTRLLHAPDVTPPMMLGAGGYIFVFPENLAAISGVMKAFFDRCYYPCLGQIDGHAYAAIVCAGSDGRNAVAQVERIATGWRLRKVAESRIVLTHAQTPEEILAAKTISETDLAAALELGATMAAGLAMGAF